MKEIIDIYMRKVFRERRAGGHARGFFLLLLAFESRGDGFKWTERDRIEWGGGRRTLLLGFVGAGAGGENSCKLRELILSHQFYFCSEVSEVFFCFSAENWQFCRCLLHPGINPFERASVMSPDGIIPFL